MTELTPPRPRSRAALGLTAAAARGSFELQVCRACGAVQYPPREACHRCLGSRLEWRPQDGAGELISETRLLHSHDAFFRERVPLRLGLVRLDCGPTALVYVHPAVPAFPARVAVGVRLDKAGQGVLVAFPAGGSMTENDRLREERHLREMTCDPRGRVVLVTDATTALGAALVADLVKAGAAAVWAGHPRDPLTVTAKEVKPVPLDVTRDNSVRAAAATVECNLDLIINTAQALGNAQQEMDTNYFGLLRLSQSFTGTVAWVNVLSVYALQSFPQLETFAASMAAAHSLSQALRATKLAAGIRLINVFPGLVDDERARSLQAPKIAPAALARAIVKALQDGVEDVYPGDAAQEWFARWRENPKVLEREVSANWRPG